MKGRELSSDEEDSGSNKLKFYPYSNNSLTRSVATLNLSLSQDVLQRIRHDDEAEELDERDEDINGDEDIDATGSINITAADDDMDAYMHNWSPFNYVESQSNNSSKSELSPFVNNPETLKMWQWSKQDKPVNTSIVITDDSSSNSPLRQMSMRRDLAEDSFEVAKPDPMAFESSGLKPKVPQQNLDSMLAVPNTPVKKSPLIDTSHMHTFSSTKTESSILAFSDVHYNNINTELTSFIHSPSLNRTPLNNKFYNSTRIIEDSPLNTLHREHQVRTSSHNKSANTRALHSTTHTPDSEQKNSYKKIKKSRDSMVIKNIELSNSLQQFTNDLYDDQEEKKSNQPTIFEGNDECKDDDCDNDSILEMRKKRGRLSLNIPSPDSKALKTQNTHNGIIRIDSVEKMPELLTPTRTKSIAGAKRMTNISDNRSPNVFNPKNSSSPLSTHKIGQRIANPDDHLYTKFINVSIIGQGPFSTVYYAEFPGASKKYAIKSMQVNKKNPLKRILQEIRLLSEISSTNLDEEGKEYVIDYVSSWKHEGSYYIMSDYYENGNLDRFLQEQVIAKKTRLEDWRLWKIMVEICLGLRFIHDACHIVHLDLKPANIFVTFEGNLKIGDFGMATHLPLVDDSFENEGDREYIAPEIILDSVYDYKADIFSLGLIMVEIAANVVLPDNGNAWQKLRSGDISDAGRLSSTDIHSESLLSAATKVEHGNSGLLDFDREVLASIDPNKDAGMGELHILPHSSTTKVSNKIQSRKENATEVRNSGIPAWVPKFLIDGESLENIVKWMIEPNYKRRPSADEILHTEECLYVELTRKAGAVIQEDDYGPAPRYFE